MIRIAISLLVLLATSATAARACSCVEPSPPLEAMKDATAVFSGRVVAAEPTGGNGYDYTIRVYAVWKGPAPDLIEVSTEDVAMCGLAMGVGSEYLVYAGGEPEQLSTSNCSRSTLLEFATLDLAELGTPLTVAVSDRSMAMLKGRYE